jgi:hypothetical protein
LEKQLSQQSDTGFAVFTNKAGNIFRLALDKHHSRPTYHDSEPPPPLWVIFLISLLPTGCFVMMLRWKLLSSRNSRVEAIVRKVYTQYNPAKLTDVPALMQAYYGREDELLRLLAEKYESSDPKAEPKKTR